MNRASLHCNEISEVVKRRSHGGFVLIATIIMTMTLGLIGASLLGMKSDSIADSSIQREEVQALYLAESGASEAIWYLQNIDILWVGDNPVEHTTNKGSYTITIDHSASPKITIISTGYIPNLANARVKRTIQVIGDLI